MSGRPYRGPSEMRVPEKHRARAGDTIAGMEQNGRKPE
jgi:hypothetical protein